MRTVIRWGSRGQMAFFDALAGGIGRPWRPDTSPLSRAPARHPPDFGPTDERSSHHRAADDQREGAAP